MSHFLLSEPFLMFCLKTFSTSCGQCCHDTKNKMFEEKISRYTLNFFRFRQKKKDQKHLEIQDNKYKINCAIFIGIPSIFVLLFVNMMKTDKFKCLLAKDYMVISIGIFK